MAAMFLRHEGFLGAGGYLKRSRSITLAIADAIGVCAAVGAFMKVQALQILQATGTRDAQKVRFNTCWLAACGLCAR